MAHEHIPPHIVLPLTAMLSPRDVLEIALSSDLDALPASINHENPLRASLREGVQRFLVPFLPPDVFAWDDSSNNKALISGQAAFIFNPPSAWAVAVRDAPKVAELCWHFSSPTGPKGRFDPAQPSFSWTRSQASQRCSGVKSMMRKP